MGGAALRPVGPVLAHALVGDGLVAVDLGGHQAAGGVLDQLGHRRLSSFAVQRGSSISSSNSAAVRTAPGQVTCVKFFGLDPLERRPAADRFAPRISVHKVLPVRSA